MKKFIYYPNFVCKRKLKGQLVMNFKIEIIGRGVVDYATGKAFETICNDVTFFDIAED